MDAFLIDGESQGIEPVDVACLADIAKLLGQDTVISDEIDARDAVYFDEDCFIRGTSGRFRVDNLAPIACRAIVVGNARGEQLGNVSLSLDDLKGRVAFL